MRAGMQYICMHLCIKKSKNNKTESINLDIVFFLAESAI